MARNRLAFLPSLGGLGVGAGAVRRTVVFDQHPVRSKSVPTPFASGGDAVSGRCGRGRRWPFRGGRSVAGMLRRRGLRGRGSGRRSHRARRFLVLTTKRAGVLGRRSAAAGTVTVAVFDDANPVPHPIARPKAGIFAIGTSRGRGRRRWGGFAGARDRRAVRQGGNLRIVEIRCFTRTGRMAGVANCDPAKDRMLVPLTAVPWAFRPVDGGGRGRGCARIFRRGSGRWRVDAVHRQIDRTARPVLRNLALAAPGAVIDGDLPEVQL